jgi:NTP pyrophosphatase (non-canonical NTP hydrolase)
MNFEEYTRAARQTAIYPDQYSGVYPLIGLVDEFAEFLETYHNYPIMPGDYENWRQSCIAELGDCVWYYAIFCDDHFLSMDMFFETAAIDTDTEAIFSTCGKLLGVVKKAMRDSHFPVSSARVINLMDSLAGYIRFFAEDLNVSLEDVLETNIAKLRSRQERGVIQGSGDNR